MELELLFYSFCFLHTVFGTSIFYENSIPYEYNFSVKFDYPREFTCACISGLWELQSTEGSALEYIGGYPNYCSDIPNFPVTKAIQLLKSSSDLSLQKPDGTLIFLNSESKRSDLKLAPNDLLIAGTKWTILDNLGREYCLQPDSNSFCFFHWEGTKPDEISSTIDFLIWEGCTHEAIPVLPTRCIKIHEKNENICETALSRKRRSFFGFPGGRSNPKLNSSNIYDEDLVNATTDGTEKKDNDLIISEIYNYFAERIDELLDLQEIDNEIDDDEGPDNSTSTQPKSKSRKKRKATAAAPAPKNKNAKAAEGNKKLPASKKGYKLPIYKLLNQSKEIMKKTCPSGYVNPEFFDLAVTAFINIQKKYLRFPTGGISFTDFDHVMSVMQQCYDNATEFNFTINYCASSKQPVSGAFCAFGNCSLELNVPGGFDEFEPIVETVWKIVQNAHSYCFSYFDGHFNDHHRFTRWMLPLFQNAMSDIWKNGTAKGLVYGGILGIQENVQTAVTYCTAASQLVTPYPWDLPRPERIPDELPAAGK